MDAFASEAIFGELVTVLLAQDDLEIVAHFGAQLLKLACVGREHGDVSAVIYTLTDYVANKSMSHVNLSVIAFRFLDRVWPHALLGLLVIEPEDVVPHSDHVREISNAGMILEARVLGISDEG